MHSARAACLLAPRRAPSTTRRIVLRGHSRHTFPPSSCRPFSTTYALKDETNNTSLTDRFSLRNKTILITGGGRGIGYAICESIAQLGGNIAVLDHLPQPVNEFHSLASKYGIKTCYQQADVTQQVSLETAFATALEQLGGRFHGCVTAAGIALDKPFVEQEWEEAQQVVNVNLMGTFWTAKLVAKHMLSHGEGGSIVLIASVTAQGVKIPHQNLAVYVMSKAAVKGLVGPLAVELGEAGIRVNSISPGVILSPMTQGQGLLPMFEKSVPLKRIGVPDDITPLAAYLLSEASSYTTGADFVVTGGLHAGVANSYLPAPPA